MSGRFMKIKRIIIPTLTILIIASQLMGCAAASQDEMLTMLNNNQAITIEIAEPINQEQGTETHIDWVELASLTTNIELREIFDDALGITTLGSNGKNGVIYVDIEGNHTNNSTLYYAFSNKKFVDNAWNKTDTISTIVKASQNTYTDVESDQAALLAGYNAYFNLLADGEPGYANLNSTLTRIESMAFIFKCDTPVQELEINEQFSEAVGNHDLAIYAQGLADQSFLNYKNLSLDEGLANSTITRAEFIYMLVQRYFSNEYNITTGNEGCYSDCKNGGDIAAKQKYITKDKKTGVVNEPNRWQAYELSYSLQNANKGMPDDLYKAMVVAYNHKLITGTESRWDEGLTKGEALNLITKTFESLGTITNAERGTSTGTIVIPQDIVSDTVDSIIDNIGQGTEEQTRVYEYLNPKTGFIDNGDGTYDFTEEFMGTIIGFDFFEGASEEDIKAYLNSSAEELKYADGQMIADMFKIYGDSDLKLSDIFAQEETTEATEPTVDENSQAEQNDNTINEFSEQNTENQNNSSLEGEGSSSSSDTTTETPSVNSNKPTTGGPMDYFFQEDNFPEYSGQGTIPEGFVGIF